MDNIVLHVYYHCHPGQAPVFVQALKDAGLQATVRGEDGCLQYDYHLSCEQADTAMLLEKWRDAGALEKHLAQPHMDKIRKIKEQFVSETTVEKFF